MAKRYFKPFTPVGGETSPFLDQGLRDRIRSSAGGIVNALTEHVNGKRELSPTQVASAKILLGKVLPDLQQVEHGGRLEVAVIADKPLSAEEFAAQFCDPPQPILRLPKAG